MWCDHWRFSEDELYGEAVRRNLYLTEDSDPSSVFDSVIMSMSDTLNSINTIESCERTPDDIPFSIITDTTRDTTLRYGHNHTQKNHLVRIFVHIYAVVYIYIGIYAACEPAFYNFIFENYIDINCSNKSYLPR